MLDDLIQLIILFLVIFDPLASFTIFFAASRGMDKKERVGMARLALMVAFSLSFLVLLLGESILILFDTNINEFKIAGGLILGILGIRMALGLPLANVEDLKNNSGRAIAALIGTPLLTGPAVITAIIISANEFGSFLTGLAIIIVLGFTSIFFLQADRVNKYLGKTGVQVISTILGLITLSWGVKFVTSGLLAIIY